MSLTGTNVFNVDSGGTFTDGVLEIDGAVHNVKVDTTPGSPVKCLFDCVSAAAAAIGVDHEELLDRLDLVRYSTTSGTNSVIQGTGSKVGLIVAEGAGEDLYGQGPDSGISSFLEMSLVREVRSESGAEGGGPASEQLRGAIESLLDGGARVVVVAFSGATTAPAAELRAKAMFDEWFPMHYLGRPFLLLAHQVTARGTDAERLNSAVVAAYLHREVAENLYRCDEAVRSGGLRSPLLVVHSSGTVARVAKTKALHTYNSGPTAGAYGAARAAEEMGLDRVITLDIGGTSTDVTFIEQGRVPLSRSTKIAGVEVRIPMIEVLNLGAGGGSLLSVVDSELKIGPESAGAVPGPACYGLGNHQATITDANVVLGLIDPTMFLGGRRALDPELAASALRDSVAEPLGASIAKAANAARRVVAAQIAETVKAEADGSDFDLDGAHLFAYGGAGALHAADIAGRLGVSFTVFSNSAVFSAAGAGTMPIAHQYEVIIGRAAGAVSEAMALLRDRAARDVRGEGRNAAEATYSFEIEHRDGTRAAIAPGGAGSEFSPGDLLALVVEVPEDRALVAVPEPAAAVPRAERRRTVEWADGPVETPVIALTSIVNRSVSGPALLETPDTCCVVPPGWLAESADGRVVTVKKKGVT